MSKLSSYTLFSVLNKDIPFGKALNGLGHMCLGMGHKFPAGKMPAIVVHFADSKSIFRIREEYQAHLAGNPGIIFSDFIDTMTGGTAEQQLKNTAEKHTQDFQYYGATLCADDSIIREVQSRFGQHHKILSEYIPFLSTDHERTFELLEQPVNQVSSLQSYKGSIVASKQLPPAELINSVARVAVEVGRKVDVASLRLLEFVDADNSIHSCISYHPLTILTAKSQSKLNIMAGSVSETLGEKSAILISKDESVTILCAFSTSELIEQCINKKDTSLFNKEIVQDFFMPFKLGIDVTDFQSDEDYKKDKEEGKEEIGTINTTVVIDSSIVSGTELSNVSSSELLGNNDDNSE